MKNLKRFWPLPLILAAFFAGQFSGGKPEKELIQKFEQEQERDRAAISGLLEKLALKDQQSATIRQRMTQRIAEKDSALNAERRASTHYRKLNERINLSRTTIPELDSLRAALRGTLHPN